MDMESGSKELPNRKRALNASSSDRTRDALLKAGQKLFSERGFAATTVLDIAKLADVNVSLVSYHFRGKEGLFRACVERIGQSRLRVAETLLETPHSIEEFKMRLDMFVEQLMAFHIENPETCRILSHDVEGEISMVKDIFANTILKSYERLVEFFQAAKAQGILRSDIEPIIAAGLFYSMPIQVILSEYVASTFLSLSIKDPEFRRKIRWHMVENMVEGLKSPTSP